MRRVLRKLPASSARRWAPGKPGLMQAGAATFVERFYREQQHLAAHDHPNITRLLISYAPYWADALIKSGRAAEAVNLLESALPTWRRVVAIARINPTCCISWLAPI
jgi:hypothetical protein